MSNVMKEVVLDKVVLNIGVGEGGEKLKKAENVLRLLTNKDPVTTISKKTIRDWNLRKNQPVGVKVTLRKAEALTFLKRALWVKDFKVPSYSFDNNGNLSFGVRDYTTFEGMKYDPDIGIFGLDVNVSFKRKGGYRVELRRIRSKKISSKERLKREETIEFMAKNFNLKVIEVK